MLAQYQKMKIFLRTSNAESLFATVPETNFDSAKTVPVVRVELSSELECRPLRRRRRHRRRREEDKSQSDIFRCGFALRLTDPGLDFEIRL